VPIIAGFLHQFKLTDKVSPEYTIYVPKSTIVRNIPQDKDSVVSDKQEYYSFEIHVKATLRDKVYVFRTFDYNEMLIWCQLFETVASNKRPFSNPMRQDVSLSELHSTSNHSSLRLDSSISERQTLEQESTPPPSPQKEERRSVSSLDNEDQKSISSQPMHSLSNQYAPQLNI
jgi:hypothetical protein